MTPTSWSRLSDLPLAVERVRLVPLELTRDGWTRRSTIVELHGGGAVGVGEDVNYIAEEQLTFQAWSGDERLLGETTLEGFGRELDPLDVMFPPTKEPASRLYRRWAFESAALDLALKLAGTNLAERLGRPHRPVRFAASLGLGDPATTRPLLERLERVPSLRFKLDWSPAWDDAVLADLAALDIVDVVDFKGRYHGDFQGPAPDADAYRRVAEALPQAVLEDAAQVPACLEALAPHQGRVSCDAPLHSLADIVTEPMRLRWVNVKPSRFGSVAELLRVYDWCEANGVATYGGGQYELGPGPAPDPGAGEPVPRRRSE